MKFTRLRLTGFKSFVDPTELQIEPGLTGVVGPNGCGKSNLVEALRWVMGETSAKSLRGSGMEDVIFSGTNGRPARNMAEVVLSIDNAERRANALFNDLDTLDVTRRIERDAGSAYRVNGKDVRARDVQTLFADLSSGAHSPALVRQGQIGQLINAKPQNRRMILEEAAGISGLHSRRHEAELRLRAAETNLTRLEDVVQELEAQLGSLKRQARQASRYRNIADHIRKCEAIMLFLRWRDASEAVQVSERSFRELEQRVAQLSEEAAAASRAQAEASEGLPDLREAEAAAAAALHRLTVERDTLDAEEQRARDQIARSEALLEQIAGDIAREEASVSDGDGELTRLGEEAEQLQADSGGLDDKTQSAEAALAEKTTALSDAESALDTATHEAAQAQARRTGLERRKADLEARGDRLIRDLEKAVQEQDALLADGADTAEIDEARGDLGRAEEATKQAEEEAAQAEERRGQAVQAEAQAREPMQDADRTVSALNAEAKTLSRMLEAQENDLWPPLVDAVTVETGFEAALGAALGDDLTAPTDDAAPMHWKALSALDPAPALPEDARPLAEVVNGPPALVRRLSQIGLVDKDQGAALQASLKPGQRLVSAQGDLWRWDGFTVAAEAPTPAAVRLAQRNRLTELDAELSEAEAAARAAREAYHAARQAAEEAAQTERDARQAARQVAQTAASARNRLAELEKTASKHQSRLAAINDTRQRLEGEIKDVNSGIEETETALGQEGDGTDRTQTIATLKDSVATLRLEASEARAALEGLRREDAMRRSRLAEIEKTREGWLARKESAAAQLGQLQARRAKTAEELESLRQIPATMEERKRGLLGALEEAEAKRTTAASALQEAENALREADSAARKLQADLSTAREDRARQEATLEGLRERVEDTITHTRETLDCTPDKVLDVGGVKEDEALPPLDEVERKLDRLKRERDNMGAVNLRAEEEAAEYAERLESMTTEREDLIQAIDKLRAGISSLNKEGRERLLAAFDTVNTHFTSLFTKLFGGGTAHLDLVESDDPLEAGLEIFARPPGKKLQSLSLLSGGEQALTAMSLIFAVFLSNPAPICVLDEVDAPLDDANVDRFCNLLDQMTKETDTRFLIITHHALTMSRMDRLYGVTMAERGVSQLVSVDLQEAEQVVAAQ